MRRGGASLVYDLTRGCAVALIGLVASTCGSPPAATDPLPEPTCPAPGPAVGIGGHGEVGDAPASPLRRIVLMGGGREDDSAARSFVEAANGGDLVVLRASGSLTSYPDYFSGASGALAPDPAPSSVLTLLVGGRAQGGDPGVLCRIGFAEAAWLAGGNQWNYLGSWPAVLHDSVAALASKGIAVGGTSAGAMVLGGGAFSAERGSITSADALADPLAPRVSVVLSGLAQRELDGTVIDTHFTERDREGRLLAFLARYRAIVQAERVFGLGIDEGVSVVIEDAGYMVLGTTGRGAHLYEFSGSSRLVQGEPLGMDGVRRSRLGIGSAGAWPPILSPDDTDILAVVDGTVVIRSASRA